jgi:hypothetical protein
MLFFSQLLCVVEGFTMKMISRQTKEQCLAHLLCLWYWWLYNVGCNLASSTEFFFSGLKNFLQVRHLPTRLAQNIPMCVCYHCEMLWTLSWFSSQRRHELGNLNQPLFNDTFSQLSPNNLFSSTKIKSPWIYVKVIVLVH